MSGIRPPDCSKLTKNSKNDNDVIIFRHDVNVRFSWRCFVSLVKFSYWSKFHLNIITGSGIMTEPVMLLRWNRMLLNLIECYWMLQNSRVTAFTVFELLRENQLGGKIPPSPLPTQIRVKCAKNVKKCSLNLREKILSLPRKSGLINIISKLCISIFELSWCIKK